MKYIGIVCRVEQIDNNSFMTGIGEYYRNALLKYDNVSPIVILPPKDILYGKTKYREEIEISPEENKKLDDLLDLCAGFIIPGGSHWYSFDEYVIKYALDNDKPILGICLGMQLLGIMDNKLNDSPFVTTNKIESNCHYQPDVDYVHNINIKKETKLYNILKTDTCQVNSRHHYEVKNFVDFIPAAYSDDGVVEAIEHPNKKFAIGVQWHPELMLDYDKNMKKIFDTFIEATETNEIECLVLN